MGSDIYVSYIKNPDAEFFKMKKRQDFIIANGLPTPDDVEEYFMENEPHKDGVQIQLPTTYHYDDMDYFVAKFKVKDIPDGVETIIVEYG